MLGTYTAGFSLGLSLILAIGAQNAFVLKQGLKKEYVFTASAICALSDAILIFAGVAGFGALIQAYPQIEVVARYAGASFLLAYALKSFYSAFTINHGLIAEGETVSSLSKTVLTCLAFTWLNPHVYLDTVVLLGSISTQYAETKWIFAAGAMTASFVFFFSLGYGARVLRPVFSKPQSWKVLDVLIGLVMIAIASSLIYSQ
jgi:L-lysine exporter family protein LysE/ArgO